MSLKRRAAQKMPEPASEFERARAEAERARQDRDRARREAERSRRDLLRRETAAFRFRPQSGRGYPTTHSKRLKARRKRSRVRA